MNPNFRTEPWVLVGGSGAVGTATAQRLLAAGHPVTVVDRNPPPRLVHDRVRWVPLDLLEAETVALPPDGRVAVLLGAPEPAPGGSWRVPLDHALATARLADALRGRDVVLVSSLDAGRVQAAGLEDWVGQVIRLASLGPCPPWRAAPVCRRLADLARGDRDLRALANRAQEMVLSGASVRRLRIVRMSEIAAEPTDDDAPLFEPPLTLVTPPRPTRPDLVAERLADALWTGSLKAGRRWSTELADVLRRLLALDDRWAVLPTTSGTSALRLAVAAVAGQADRNKIALLPSFTFPATAEAVVQLGFRPRFVDVDPRTWTLDPVATQRALEREPVGVVVGVDTFGNPLDHRRLTEICNLAGVPFVADSAAALGSTLDGQPVGGQADAHAFSMSFAKTVSAAGAGGVVVVPRWSLDRLHGAAGWLRSELMPEVNAAVALDQLAVLDSLVARRRELAARYQEGLADRACRQPAGPPLTPQRATPGAEPVLAHFVLRVGHGRRDEMADRLDRLGIQTAPYFPALHLTTHCDPASAPDPLPVTEVLHREALALPLSSEMSSGDVDRVLVGLSRVAGCRTRARAS